MKKNYIARIITHKVFEMDINDEIANLEFKNIILQQKLENTYLKQLNYIMIPNKK